MINSPKLLTDLQSKATSRTTMVKKLEDDLRKRCDAEAEVDAPLRVQYEAAKGKKRTALTYKAWREEELTQVAVAWVLACVFVRFLEDNELVETSKLSGPGPRLQRARDEHEMFFRQHPTATEREYLLGVFEDTGRLPGMKEFFDRKHNPLWLAAPSGDACRELWQFWQKTDAVTGALVHDFTDPDWNTRFLGDLYQDLSEAARKRYALLQTPDFVEEFILDRTLTPAIETFGYRDVRMIDPTCGSGHFLLGGFARIFRIWQAEHPGENPRVLAQRALDAVSGVDLNPFAVAIARFRLLLAALHVCGVKQLKNAPDFQINLAVGDSLIHGARFHSEGNPCVVQRQGMFGGEEAFKDELAHYFDTEDRALLHRILGQQYHAVVGNPPYINVKDQALNQLYRDRYDTCHRQYALSVPFMERFFDLTLRGSSDGRDPGGFTGQITASSFMKKAFGKKLVENYFKKVDLTHILDVSGAYIPGHNGQKGGTSTVIIFGRNRKFSSSVVRAVMGLRGEPETPKDPRHGIVWEAILSQIDHPGSESDFISVYDVDREVCFSHPWSLGGAGGLKLRMMLEGTQHQLSSIADESGCSIVTRADEAFLVTKQCCQRRGIPLKQIRRIATGKMLRDWIVGEHFSGIWPYESNGSSATETGELTRFLWQCKGLLSRRVAFGVSQLERGLKWYEYSMYFSKRDRSVFRIAYPEKAATHNHFVLDREGILFQDSSSVILLPHSAEEKDYVSLTGQLNSSIVCYWLRQVCQRKGGYGGGAWEDRIVITAGILGKLPLSREAPEKLSAEIDRRAQWYRELSPENVLCSLEQTSNGSATSEPLNLAFSRVKGDAELTRGKMISLQEELDWQCYRLYGLIDASDGLEWPDERLEALPPLTLGERAFEIHMARQMAAGELETTWFERHEDAGSKPITDLPSHWPDDYRALVERRLAFIEESTTINLIERPEYKRRWNTELWANRHQDALRKWLLARLEGYFFEGSRVCDLAGRFDTAALGFTAATRPHLVSANQLADIAQSDTVFMEVAENQVGSSGFSVPKLVRELVEGESVPYLPFQRYEDSGLRKREDWEHVWDLQRREDSIDAEEEVDELGITDVERLRRQAAAKDRKQRELGDSPVPPEYGNGDFVKSSYWRLRGKLDVAKERWISYPGAERAGDESLVIAWAGWDHLQQAQALAEYYLDAKDNRGWPVDRLKPLLAGLADLIPWLKQWHNTPDPNLGMGLGDYFAGFLDEQCRGMGITPEMLSASRFLPML